MIDRLTAPSRRPLYSTLTRFFIEIPPMTSLPGQHGSHGVESSGDPRRDALPPTPPNLSDADDRAWEKELSDAMGDLGDAGRGMLFADQPAAARGEGDGVIRAKVVAVHGDDVFVDTGGKHQGVVSRSDLQSPPGIGDELELVIDRFDAESGLLILSRQGAVRAATWANLAPGTIVEGRVTGMNKGGLEVDLKGIRGFMPASHVDVNRIPDISVLIGERVRAEVLEINKKDKNVLLSRRKLLARERDEMKEQTLNDLKEGDVREGVVSRLADFGAFIDLGGVDGLLHISDISWSRLEKVGDALKEGQQISVKVLKIDREKDRISLGLKQLAANPWDNVEVNYPLGARIKGRVTRLADFGAFVELEPGVEGLLPISEMSWGRRLRHPSDMIQAGQIVDVAVLKVEAKKKRMSLSLKQMDDDPWNGVAAAFPQNAVVTGKVARLTDFGAFIELRPGVDGLVHISEMSQKRIRTPGDVVKEGEEVQARVLNVDEGQRRISLTMKSLEPTEAVEHVMHHEPAAPKKKRKKPLRGGLSSHFEW